MPESKKVKKTTKKAKETVNNTDININKEKINKIADDAIAKVKELKTKFGKMDKENKKKIFAGLSAAAAGLFAISKIKKRSDKKREEVKSEKENK